MIEFEFETSVSPWDLALSRLKSGQTLSARRFLALVESSEELSAEDAALELESRGGDAGHHRSSAGVCEPGDSNSAGIGKKNAGAGEPDG